MDNKEYIKILEEGALNFLESLGGNNKKNSLVKEPKSKKGKGKLDIGEEISKMLDNVGDGDDAIQDVLDTDNLDVDGVDDSIADDIACKESNTEDVKPADIKTEEPTTVSNIEFTEQELSIFNKLMSEIDSLGELEETTNEDNIDISGEIMSDEELERLDEQFKMIEDDEDIDLDTFVLDADIDEELYK
jgi:hypothetical protein